MHFRLPPRSMTLTYYKFEISRNFAVWKLLPDLKLANRASLMDI